MPQLTPLPCQRHAMGLRLRQELRTCSTALRRIQPGQGTPAEGRGDDGHP
jgi:hypothetical protein